MRPDRKNTKKDAHGHLCECALGMLQGGMRTADVARTINCNVRTVRRLRRQLIVLAMADHV